ncbi:MAG: regulatory protein RecX [Woeseiaceae bacterium]
MDESLIGESLVDDKFENPVEARKKAMDYLARREHGRVELVEKVARFGFDEAVADDAVAQLVDENLQSDERYVEAFIASRINQGKGPVKIRAELRERGIGGSVIDIALEDADQDWYASAVLVREKKFGVERPKDFNEKARQMRFLQSRGFDTDQIQSAVSA